MSIIECSVVEGIATVVLNRPEVSNALSADLIRDLRRTMIAVDQADDVRVVILTGAGHAFCAGLDLNELAGSADNLRETHPDRSGGRPWPQLGKPVIGAVNGAAYTGGLEIALTCDLLVASHAARFADTHARVGVMPGWGMSVLLPAAIGEPAARAMSLTGAPITAQRALELGLVQHVVSDDLLMLTAREVAANMMRADAGAIAMLLEVYRRTAGHDRATALHTEIELGQRWLSASRSEDGRVRKDSDG